MADSHSVEQRLGPPTKGNRKPTLVMETAAMRDQEQHRYAERNGPAHQRIGGHTESRILHNEHRLLATQPCPHADAYTVAFVGDLDIINFGFGAKRLVQFFKGRIWQARREIDP